MVGYSLWGHKESDATEQLTMQLYTESLKPFHELNYLCFSDEAQGKNGSS